MIADNCYIFRICHVVVFQCLLVLPCSSFSVGCDKSPPKVKMGRKRFCWLTHPSHSPSSGEVRAGAEGWHLEARAEIEPLKNAASCLVSLSLLNSCWCPWAVLLWRAMLICMNFTATWGHADVLGWFCHWGLCYCQGPAASEGHIDVCHLYWHRRPCGCL